MRTRISILLLAAVLVVPAGAVGWGAKGQFEPDTALDTSGGYMWLTPDTTSGTPRRGVQVYFNGFTSHSIGSHAEIGTSFNPNFATIQSERWSWNGRVMAMLGIWKDCNNDGMIGFGDNGLLEYRATLLLNTAICPGQSVNYGPPANQPHNVDLAHNDGTWVREFIPIHPDENRLANPDKNPTNIMDNGARVWVDWGKPGDLPPTSRCYLFAPASTDQENHPEWGTYHTTGGLIAYIDCWPDFYATNAWNNNAPDNTPAGRLTFKDTPNRDYWNSSSRLNQKNPWGDERQGSFVEVFDCSKPQLVPVIRQGILGVGVSQPKVPPTVNQPGAPTAANPLGGLHGQYTVGGTVNQTLTGLADCNRSNNKGQFEGQASSGLYAQESPGLTNTAGAKIQTDFVLSSDEGFRPWPIAQAPQPLGRAQSSDLGTRTFLTEGLWISTTVTGEDRNPYIDRTELDGNPFQKVQYITTYGYVSDTAKQTWNLVLNPSSSKTGLYGQESCGADIGVTIEKNGWQCNGAKWWPGGCGPEGYSCGALIDGVANTDISVRPGQLYNVRDVDCYDGSVMGARQLGAHWGVLTGSRCA